MDDLQRLLDDFIAAHPPLAPGVDGMPGVVMHVDAPRAGVRWTGAAGVIERGGAPLTPDACFRTASVTKTYVATAVMRLVEQGRLHLTDPLLDHLPVDTADLVRRSVAHSPAITVEQVLRHTSGIYDFGTDPTYRRTIGREPHKVWSAADLIGIALEHDHPHDPSGVTFHYSDTGYVLLALMLERATGTGFASALRALVGLDVLGLPFTWLEGKEPVPADAPPRAHQYLGADDTFHFDPSFDGYGGGGLVSTAGELARFLRALVDGEVLGRAETAALLDTTTPTDLGELGQRCGLGIFASTVEGIERIGHEGFWGIWMYHFPAHDITIAGAHTGLPYDGTAKRALLHGPIRLLSA
ncbi:MAG: serine hydrolase [Actinobacteria bacterium]|nr:serine hydrolase [Actinomycetota bacterium]